MSKLVKMTINESDKASANSIAAAFDPDTGGNKTFDAEAVGGLVVVNVPMRQSLLSQLSGWNNGGGTTPAKPYSFAGDDADFEAALRTITFEVL